jgi:hypothetical protein
LEVVGVAPNLLSYHLRVLRPFLNSALLFDLRPSSRDFAAIEGLTVVPHPDH